MIKPKLSLVPCMIFTWYGVFYRYDKGTVALSSPTHDRISDTSIEQHRRWWMGLSSKRVELDFRFSCVYDSIMSASGAASVN